MKQIDIETSTLIDCTSCDRTDCIHRDAFRRYPKAFGGLGLCPKLSEPKEIVDSYEMCPHCEHENHFRVERDRYFANCQYCGKEIMLCADCYFDGNGKCDWSEDHGCYRKPR